MGGAEANIFYPQPEPEKNLEPEPKKNGSAPQHWVGQHTIVGFHPIKVCSISNRKNTGTCSYLVSRGM